MTRILVVDDEADLADSLEMLFGAMGHDARAIYRGENAVATTAEFRPHIVFLDLQMPVMDGFAAARAICAAPGADHPFLVALSAMVGVDVRACTEAAGFDLYMTKPADTTAILSLVKDLARRERPANRPGS
jgi:CheY-like chemotaxis protein